MPTHMPKAISPAQPAPLRSGADTAPDPGRAGNDDLLNAVGTVISVPQARELYCEGSSADAWFQVRSGALRTCKLLLDGRRQIDAFLLPNDFFGFERLPEHGSSAEAIMPTTVVRYSRARTEKLADEDSRIGRQLLDITLKQLNAAQDRILLLGRKTAEEKLATFLLEMLVRSSGGDAVDLPMSRIDIADYLGLTIETVSRTLSAFRREGIIRLPTPQTVVVPDRFVLERLAGAS